MVLLHAAIKISRQTLSSLLSRENNLKKNTSKYFFAVVVDLDEYILPANFTNLTSFLETKVASNKNAAYFLFQNVFHYLYWENSTSLLKQEWKNKRSGDSLPYLLTQTKLRRTKQPHKHANRSKYVTRPDKVTNLGNHNVWSILPGKVFKRISDVRYVLALLLVSDKYLWHFMYLPFHVSAMISYFFFSLSFVFKKTKTQNSRN